MRYTSKEEILSYIWQEKREKIVTDKIYPLGISITVEDLNFNWHAIAYGIISLLKENVEQAFVWSKNWGRSVILVHPKKSLSFCFTLDESLEEKLGVFLSTYNKVDPIDLLDKRYNVGDFKILLNHRKMLLEAAILQVERMVDELIWCNFLRFKEINQEKQKEDFQEVELYSKSLDEVLVRGITFEYISEDEIIHKKMKDLSLPVRVYGNVLKSEKVPNIIGAVVLPNNNNVSDNKYSFFCNDLLINIVKNKQNNEIYLPLQPNVIADKIPYVCSAITIAKEIHAGHLLLLSYTEMIRNSIASPYPLYLESNDIGERIIGTIASLVEKNNSTVESVINDLNKNKFQPYEIDLCYKNRKTKGKLFEEVKNKLIFVRQNLLGVMNDRTLNILKKCGFSQIVIIPDSLSLKNYDKLKKINNNKLSDLGFSFVKYTKGKHNKMIIIEKEGLPTACSARTVFLIETMSRCCEETLPIFVDADLSTIQAKDLFYLAEGKNVIQIEGAGIGFCMQVASGTSGNVITVNKLFEIFIKEYSFESDKNFISTVNLFLLSRYMTAKANKSHALAKGHPLSISFFDYKNNESFVNDFLLCAKELLELRCLIEKTQKKINSCKNENIKDILMDFDLISFKRVKGLLVELATIQSKSKVIIEDIFLKIKAESLDLPLRKIREQICQKYNIQNSLKIDKIIINLFIDKEKVQIKDLNNVLFQEKIIDSVLPYQENEKLSCIFVENLKSRGYINAEISDFAMKYFQGEFCLLKKKCIFFEHFKDIVKIVQSLKSINPVTADLLLKSISFCIAKLGL